MTSSVARGYTTGYAGGQASTGKGLTPRLTSWRGLEGPYLLGLHPQALNAELHDLAGAQVLGRRAAQSYAVRRAGADHVPWVQGHEVADVTDDLRHGEDHVRSGAVLTAHPIQVEPQAQRLRIRHLVARDQPRSQRPEGIAALALVPRASPLDLEFAFREVVDHAVSRHEVQGLGL